MSVTKIESKDEFDKAIESEDRLVAVDFYADWCGPCKMISPKFETMAKEFPDVLMLKVNVDDQAEISEACKIEAMPTFIFYKKGRKVDEFMGADVDKLKLAIEKHK